jgi:uncharacterized lipoprotein
MLNKSFFNTIFVIAFTIIAISACASSPKKMVISPQIIDTKSNIYSGKATQVNVTDLRPNSHIVAIHREGEAIKLISANTHLDNIINDLYKKSLSKNSLAVNDSALNNIELIINTAEVHVYQELMKYKTTSQVTLTAKITSNEKTLTKTYNNKGNSEGVLTADLAVLERNFNQQLGNLIMQVVNDNEIVQFIK